MSSYEVWGLGFAPGAAKAIKKFMEPFKIKEYMKLQKEARKLEESRFLRADAIRKAKLKEEKEARLKAERARLRGLINSNIQRIRKGISNFSVNYDRTKTFAERGGYTTEEIDDLPELIAEVAKATSGMRVPTDPIDMEQAKIDTDGFLWVVDEASRRLALFNLRQRQRINRDREEHELAEHKALLMEIAAREAEIQQQREHFAKEAEKSKRDIALLKSLKAELVKEQVALNKEKNLIKAAEKELGIR